MIDLTVDGADEVDASLDLVKGAGGALVREKIVAAASATYIVIVDDAKLSARLGEHHAIPIAVIPFGHRATAEQLARLGAATLRMRDGVPVRTDDGCLLYDLRVAPVVCLTR